LTFYETINFDDLVKSRQDDGFVKSSRCKARKDLGVKRTYKVRCNDEVEAQRRRWTFYETINLSFLQKSLTPSFRRKPESRSARKNWIPGRASLARNDAFPLLSRVLQEPFMISQ